MKKRFLTVVAILIALVMSFALIACGDRVGKSGGTGGGSDPAPKLTTEKLGNAITSIQNAKTLELDINLRSVSENSAEYNMNTSVVVSGNRAKYTDPVTDYTYIVDIDTGYVYVEGSTGYYFNQQYPAGIFDYINDVVTANAQAFDNGDIDYNELINHFSYDETYGGYVATVETKDIVNPVLAFAQDAYAKDASLNDVINSLLQKATGEETLTLEALLQLACGESGYALMKDMTLAQLLGEEANGVFDEIFTALEEMDVELSAEQKAAVKNRKVGEIVAVLVGALPDIMEGDIDPEYIIPALFFSPVTSDEVNAAGAVLGAYADMLIDKLKTTKVRTLIDKAPADVKAMIATEGFAFNSVSAKLGFKFDGNDIDEIMLGCYVEHNYSGTTSKDNYFLADNKYEVTLSVGITTKDTEENLEVTKFADDAQLCLVAYPVIKGYTGKAEAIYFETAGKEVTVSEIEASVFDGESFIDLDQSSVTFDNDSSSFVVSSGALKDIASGVYGEYNIFVMYKVEFDDDYDYGYLSVTVMPDATLDTFSSFITDMIGSIMN